MIDREQIRKSVVTKQLSKNDKNNNKPDLIEWKFTFPSLLQCRLWFNAIFKLKQHFLKQENKYEEFLENFDPDRKSRSKTDFSP